MEYLNTDGMLADKYERHNASAEAYAYWFEDQEDWLLEQFLIDNPKIGPVKSWGKVEAKLFEEFCQEEFNNRDGDD